MRKKKKKMEKLKNELVDARHLKKANDEELRDYLSKELSSYYKDYPELLNNLIYYYTTTPIYKWHSQLIAIDYRAIDTKKDDKFIILFEECIEFTQKGYSPLIVKWYTLEDSNGQDYYL